MRKRLGLTGWYKLRWQVLERDNFTCQYCGQAAPDVKLEADHKISVADGGSDDLDNLITSCWACNRGKSGLRQSIVLAKDNRNEMRKIATKGRKKEILRILSENPDGLSSKELTGLATDATSNRICVALSSLKGQSRVELKKGNWFIIPAF